jgi:ribonuclease Z
MYINYKIEIIEVEQPGIVFSGDDYAIEAFSLNHTKPCYGYSFTENKRPGVFYPEKASELGIPKGRMWAELQGGGSIELEDGRVILPEMVTGEKRSGRKFSFVTDTAYFPEIADSVRDSDVLICEGMFTEELSESAASKKHLTAVQAAKIAVSAGGIGKMGLIHYSPRYNDREILKLLEEAKPVFPGSFLTRDRQIIEIKNKD